MNDNTSFSTLSAVIMSGKKALSLYKQLLRESHKVSQYNYRNYALRKIHDTFHQNKHVTDQNETASLLKEAEKNLEIIKRQVVIGQMYHARPLVIESEMAEDCA